MTYVTRTYLGFGRVALVTVRVRLNTGRDRLPCSRRLMAGNAALARQAFARVVCGVIEFHVESLDKARREFMHRRRDRVHVAVTYRAHHLLLGVGELADVTSNARVVSGVFQIGRCALATMTRGAFEFFMLRYFV